MKSKLTYNELAKENEILRKKLKENKSNRKFENYCAYNKAIMLQINPLSKKIISVNKAAIDFYGYKESDLVGKTMNDINILSDKEINLKMKEAIKNKSNFFQFKHKLANGKIKDVEVYASTFTDSGIANMVVTVFDISERVKAEQEIKKLSTAVEQSANSVVITNLNGNIEYANTRFTGLSGYSSDEILGKNINIIISGAKTEDFFYKIRETISKGGIFKGEFYNKKKNKEYFWEQVTVSPIRGTKGKITNYLVIIEDITYKKNSKEKLKTQLEEYASLNEEYITTNDELKKAIEEIKESEEHYRVFSNASFEAIIISEKGIYVEQNKAAERMFGYTHEEAKNMVATDIFTDESKEIVKQNILNGNLEPYDAIALRKDGTTFEAEIQGQNFQHKGRKHRITAIRDISNRKKIEKELKEAKEKAEESDRLKSEFINNMSHEIRTPMNGILGFSDLLSQPNVPKEKRKQYIDIIQSSGKQLMRIIDDILEISRLGTKQVKALKKEVCLNEVLLQQFSIFNIKAKNKGIPLYLKTKLSNKKSTIYTDKTKLIKIISNLLENSLKFTTKGFIEFGYHLIEKESGNFLEIYVKDTGVGIKLNMQESIFNRFSQEEKEISQNLGGLGLGLTIAKENTELIGGKISVSSIKGEGATFFVTIPYDAVFSNQETEKNIFNDNLENHNKKDSFTILIAEDEKINFLYLDVILESIFKNSVRIHAKHGKEAVEICKENNDINLVLMDLKMPVMNGLEATKKIKQTNPKLKIIAQTAYSTNEEKEKAFSAGCDDFISKPIEKKKLSEILNKYLIVL